jgi:glycine cleavage system transcriptional repressor
MIAEKPLDLRATLARIKGVSMKKYAVLSAHGNDRIGIADDITDALGKFRVNLEESRMAALGGRFAILMMLSGGREELTELKANLAGIGASLGFRLQMKRIAAPRPSGEGLPYIIESHSRDAPGLAHAVTTILKKHNVNIVDMETDASPAPWTGAITFHMKAHITIPSSVSISDLKDELNTLERNRSLDILLKPVASHGAE